MAVEIMPLEMKADKYLLIFKVYFQTITKIGNKL